MCTQLNRPCRHDRARQSVLDAIDRIPPGTQFLIKDLWHGRRFGPVYAPYGLVAALCREAVEAGAIVRIGRYPSQGGPVLYRKPGPAPRNDSMQPPRGWRRPNGGAA